MNLLNNRNIQILAVLVLAVSVKLYIDHRRRGYTGAYKPDGKYDNTTAVKQDMTKHLWVELFVLMVVGLSSGESFYDSENIFGSWIGKAMAMVAGYFTYYEFVQPYVVNKMPNW